jgi:LPXTG-motif cell wall-anchored protein
MRLWGKLLGIIALAMTAVAALATAGFADPYPPPAPTVGPEVAGAGVTHSTDATTTLPVTGSSHVTLYLTIAFVLVTVGTVLVLIARRRRVA